MVSTGAVLRGLLACLLLLNVASTGVAAQTDHRRIIFDEEVREVATVHTNDQTFVVYTYESTLPYASGVEVYRNGDRVTSRKSVDEVFQALARRKATKFAPEERTIERLRRVVERSRTVQRETSEALATINATLEYRAELKERTVNGSTAWEAAVERSDALDRTFAGGMVGDAEVRDLRKKLLTVRESAADLEANATRAISLLEKRQQGIEINQSDLYRRYDAVYADLATMKKRVDAVRTTLSQTAEASRTAAKQARSTPEVGEEIHDRFTSVARSLAATTGPLGEAGSALTALRGKLPTVAADKQYQQRLTDRWQSRQSAGLKVYATLGEGFIVFAGGLIALSKH